MGSADTQFLEVRSALNHLYDPEFLAKSPLLSRFDFQSRQDPGTQLQQVLIRAIEELKPKPGDPFGIRFQRDYDLLLFRYVQKLTQDEISHQFGVSERQLRREQNHAVQVLASRLAEKYPVHPCAPTSKDNNKVQTAAQSDSIYFPWNVDSAQKNPTDPNQALPVILELISPLARKFEAEVNFPPAGNLPLLAIHPLAFRQVLLTLLGEAIKTYRGKPVNLSAKVSGDQAIFQLTVETPKPGETQADKNFDLVNQIIKTCKGKMTWDPSSPTLNIQLWVPALPQTPILMIDDNQDLHQLFTRYTAGSPFQLITTNDPEQIFPMIASLNPRAIILDVMMPSMDGWEILTRIRRNPTSANTPVILCTILNQEELAFSLGVNAYLHKPVSQSDLLQVLNQVLMTAD